MPNYALSVNLPGLPAGEKKYDLLSRESAEDRAASLCALESMEDLLASLEEAEEVQLRALLSEGASGEDAPLIVTVSESNYLVLASIIDHLAEEATAEPVVVAEPAQAEPAAVTEAVAEFPQLEALNSLLASEKFAQFLAPVETDSTLREALVQVIALSEKTLGLEASTSLSEETVETLKVQAAYLYARAVAAPAVSEALVVAPVVVDVTEGDTLPGAIVVENPTLGEEHTTEVTPVVLPTLASLRKAAGPLSPADRKSLRSLKL